MPTLLIASTNKGKLREIQALLADVAVDLLTPLDLDLHLEVQEEGHTYAENAALKALAFARRTGLLSLGDDSGLEVEALGGAPGLHSARYAPQTGASDADRRLYLLQNLQSYPRPWLARFHCTVALATPQGELRFAEGECRGEIIPQERGEHGFGYDPIFLIPAKGRTMAELSMEKKNQLSHRARAVKAAIPLILDLL
jgi:XTP/dITP diphosphohydrolase